MILREGIFICFKIFILCRKNFKLKFYKIKNMKKILMCCCKYVDMVNFKKIILNYNYYISIIF